MRGGEIISEGHIAEPIDNSVGMAGVGGGASVIVSIVNKKCHK